MHLFRIYLAALWLILGVSLLIYDHSDPGGGGSVRIGDTNVSLGWLALALAGYNVARWLGRWKSRQAETQRTDSKCRAELARRDREFRESGRERDPNFMFDEPKSET